MNLNDICLRRLRCWIDLAREPNPIQAEIFKLELGQLGFRVRQIDRFTSTTRSEFDLGLMTLSQMRGDDVKYVPLFNNFPDDLPNDRLYLMRRVLGFFGLNAFGDRSNFGADPVTQMQSRELWESANAEQDRKLHDLHTEWLEIEVVDRATAEQKLVRWATDLLYSATPVKDRLWSDIFSILDTLKIAVDSDRIAIKETLARMATDRWGKFNTIAVKTPTDLLRMLAFMCEQELIWLLKDTPVSAIVAALNTLDPEVLPLPLLTIVNSIAIDSR